MFPLLSPEHVQLLSPSRLDAACHADDPDRPETTDDDRALARLARNERARRAGDVAPRHDRLQTPTAHAVQAVAMA